MFIDFQFGNFRSFRDIQNLTMLAAKLRSNDGGLEEDNVFEVAGFRLLKCKAVFGGNASGKSNLAKAVGAFSAMVRLSVSSEDIAKHIWEDRFQLITDWDDQPIHFQYSFLIKDKPYRYGFELLDGVINHEWLFGLEDIGEVEYFMRGPGGLSINDQYFAGAGIYMEQALSGENEIFRNDALFLTGAALNGNKIAARIRNEIRSIFTVNGISDEDAVRFAMNFLEKAPTNHKTNFKQMLRATDIGIDDIEIRDIPESLHSKIPKELREKLSEDKKNSVQTVFSKHWKYDENGNKVESISVPFSEWESEGTSKLFGILPIVLETLRTGKTLIIDEFDARFHPNLTLKIVQLFNSEKSNPNHAQFIFITHDTGLLRRAQLRRDQICLVNKDRFGISTIKTLIEYKGVRKDASYEKEYLQGSYDAVPYLDELDWIILKNLEENGLSEAQ